MMEWPSFLIELTFATVIAEVAKLQFLYHGIRTPFRQQRQQAANVWVVFFSIGMVHLLYSIETAKKMYNWLVGGLVAIFYFPRNIGLLIIPIDFHIFQRGGPTTNQI